MTKISRRMRRTAFWVATAMLGPGWLAPTQAADTVFIVAKYPVEARADNAVAAKTQALADGQQAAFRSLLKRLVPVTAYPRIRRLASVKAGSVNQGVRRHVANLLDQRTDQCQSDHLLRTTVGNGPSEVPARGVPHSQQPLVSNNAVDQLQQHIQHIV